MQVSSVGRLLRDDLHLQALYHMLVMLSPASSNSEQIQVTVIYIQISQTNFGSFISSDNSLNYISRCIIQQMLLCEPILYSLV